jgi:CheY-like chemotaxis protein
MHLVANTGWGHETDRQRAAEAGFDRHLLKPVTAETLATLLATLPASRGDDSSGAAAS